MSLLSFLDATGKVLESRARLVLDLVELQHLCRPARTWVSRSEWIGVFQRGRTWNGEWPTAKRALFRMAELLRDRAGVELLVEHQEEDGVSRIYVDTFELRELVSLHLRRARVVDELKTAKVEGREPDLGWLHETTPNVQEIAADYQDRKRPLGALSRKYGMGRDRLRRVLERQRVQVREQRRMRISERVGPEAVARALDVHDQGASLLEVSRLLRCTKWSAHRFLERHGRDTSPAHARIVRAEEPPRWQGRSAI